MILWKPVDHILTIANVHQRVFRVTAFQGAQPCLFARIFIRAQVSVGRCLRFGGLARLSRFLESVCPQRLVLQIHGSKFRDRWSLCRRSCRSMDVIVACHRYSRYEGRRNDDRRSHEIFQDSPLRSREGLYNKWRNVVERASELISEFLCKAGARPFKSRSALLSTGVPKGHDVRLIKQRRSDTLGHVWEII